MAREIYGEATEPDREKAEMLAKRRETAIRRAVAAALDGMAVAHKSERKNHLIVPQKPAIHQKAISPSRRAMHYKGKLVMSAMRHAAHPRSVSMVSAAPMPTTKVSTWSSRISHSSRTDSMAVSAAAQPVATAVTPQHIGHRPSLHSGSVLPAPGIAGGAPTVGMEDAPPAAPTPGLPGPHDDYNMWDNLWIYGSSDDGWDTVTSIFHIILVILLLFIIFAAIAAGCYSNRGGSKPSSGKDEDLGGWTRDGLRSAAHSAEELMHTASRSATDTWEGMKASLGGGGSNTAAGGSSKAGVTVSV
jgi:hypothetical protein